MTSAIPPSRDPLAIFQRECETLNTKLDQQKLRIEQIEPAFERIKACYETAVRALKASPCEELRIRAVSPEGLSEDLGAIYRATCEKLLKENPKLHLEITTPILKSESPVLRNPSPQVKDYIISTVMLDWEVTTLLNSGTSIDPKLGTYGLEQSLNCLSKLHKRLENEIRELKLKDSPELMPLLEDLNVKEKLLRAKIAEVRKNLSDLSIRDDEKFLPEKDNPYYNVIITGRIAFHSRNLETLRALDPSSPQISKLESTIANLESMKSPGEEVQGITQAIFCNMHNLNITLSSLWRHLGFQKGFNHLSHFEKEHLSIALQNDIRKIETVRREAQRINPDPRIKSVFDKELEALRSTLEALRSRLTLVEELLADSTERNKAEIESFLLSDKGFKTLSEDLRASIISELRFL